MLIPHKGIPVEKEHKAGTYQCPSVLGKNVMRHLNTKIIIFMNDVKIITLIHFNFPTVAKATVTAGLRWPPETPMLKILNF